jgi:hypothetical protein
MSRLIASLLRIHLRATTHVPQPHGPPMMLRNMSSAEDYRQLAAQDAELAKAAVTNESRAQHYVMAAYYTRLVESKEKLANTREVLTRGTHNVTFSRISSIVQVFGRRQ